MTSPPLPFRPQAGQLAQPSPEDLELSAAFLRGEPAAIAEIQSWLKAVVRKYRGRIRMPAEDALQELLLKTTSLLGHGSFRGEARLKTFLWRMANNTCLNWMREQKPEEPAEVLPDLVDPQPSPLARVLANETTAGLRRLLKDLGPECLKLWRMILAGKSYREMSLALKVSEGALRVRVLRCRRKVAQGWKQYAAGSG